MDDRDPVEKTRRDRAEMLRQLIVGVTVAYLDAGNQERLALENARNALIDAHDCAKEGL
jgi:hypothetical protein